MKAIIELVGGARRVTGPSAHSIPKRITMLEDRSMQVEMPDGRATIIGKDDIEIQAFVVMVMAGQHQDGTV